MAITAQERTGIEKVVISLFNAAPSAPLLAEFMASYEENGRSLAALADGLGSNQTFINLYPEAQTASAFAAQLLAPYSLQASADAIAFVSALFNAGVSKAQIALRVGVALDSATTTDPDIVAAKAILGNKTTVADNYAMVLGGTANTLAALQNTLAGVTHTQSSVEAAMAANAPYVPPTNPAPSNPGPSSMAFSFTAGADTFTGGAGNDAFTGSAVDTWSASDQIDGGAGTDAMTVDVTGITPPALATIVNVESLTVNASGAGYTIDATGYTGLTSLTLKDTAAGAISVTASTTTAASIVGTGASAVGVMGSGGALAITTGAAAVAVGQNGVANAITSAAVKGGSTVTIKDRSGVSAATGTSLTSVTLDGNTGAATLTGDGITAVTAANSNQNTTVVAAAGMRTQAVTFNNETGGTFTDATATTVNVISTGSASVVSDMALAAATAVTLGGDKALTLSTTHFGAATALTVNGSALTTINGYVTTNKLTSVTVTGAGGFTTNLSSQGTQLATIDASGSTGPNTVTINGTESYKGGSGVDVVTARLAPTVLVDGGAGTGDIFVMNSRPFSLANVTGFEILGLGTSSYGTYDATGFTGLTQGRTAPITGIIWSNVAAGTTLSFTQTTSENTTYNLLSNTGDDVLPLTITSSASVNINSFTATNIETVNITLVDTDTTSRNIDFLRLTDTALTTLNITGNAGLSFLYSGSTVTSVDASGMTNTAGTSNSGFTWTTYALAAASTIKGSATGGDVINASSARAAVTITETAGVNNITGSATVASSLTGGTGADTINGGSGNDTIVGGGGADVIKGGAGADSITLSGSAATVTQAAAGDSGTNTAISTDTTASTFAFDVVKNAVAGTKISLQYLVGADDATHHTYATGDLTLAGANLAAADNKIVFARGAYDANANIFTYAANGADTAMTYDVNGTGATAGETIILVGYVAGVGTTASDGVVTLA